MAVSLPDADGHRTIWLVCSSPTAAVSNSTTTSRSACRSPASDTAETRPASPFDLAADGEDATALGDSEPYDAVVLKAEELRGSS